jgi:hypothetical protein
VSALRFRLPRRLVLATSPGSATMGGGPEAVPAFEVDARVTLYSGDIFAPREPHRLALDEPLADMPVFLNEDLAPRLLHAPASAPPTTALTRPRRPSLLSRLSQVTGAAAAAVGGAGRGGTGAPAGRPPASSAVKAWARPGMDATTGSNMRR